MTKISVFGGTGFIGGTFCEMFPNEIDLIPRDQKFFDANNVLYFISTTTNQSVFKDLQVDIDVNLKILMEVLSNCKNKDVTFNFISSCFVYGNDVLNAKENDECNPTGFYSITKRCAEQLLISFCNTFKIKYRILRIGNVYGLDKTISFEKNVLGYLIQLLKENKDIKLYDGGNFLKDYTFVEDVCYAIKLILDAGEVNQIYNIAAGEPKDFKTIIQCAKNILNSKSNLINFPTPEDQKYLQVKNMTLDIEKLKSLGFSPKVRFDNGLQMLCDIV